MRNVSNNFKIDLRTYGRQLDFKIRINGIENDVDNFNYLKPSFHADLFRTIMNELEIDSKNKLEEKTKINIEAGVKVNEPVYEYINYNTYSIKTCERQEDTNSYIIKAYDKMIESMVDYDLELTEKIPLRQYLIKVCQRLGWNTKNIPATFINSEKLVDPNLHRKIGYTFRDVLDEIATLSCSALLFINDEFYLLYPVLTNESIDETYLDEDSVTIYEKYFINSLVFSRAEESDNIYRKDNVSIETYGLHEYRISDNQLLSTNDRDLYIDEMWEYLKKFEFYPFDVKSKGILYLEAYDMFNFVLGEKVYSTILLNSEVAFDDGLTEDIYTDEPNETETDYKYADSTDKKINQTYILVDKQNQKIESVISNITEQNKKISQVTQTVEELNSKIGDIADITVSKESTTATLSFEGINQSEPIRIEIHPIGTSISYLYPRDNLYPSDNLFMTRRTLRFTNTKTNEIFDYELPNDLLYHDAENYDDFILDYDGLSCVINKKVGYNADGTTYLLQNPTTISYDFPKIELTDGDYAVELLGYNNAYLFVRLMAQNIYTTQFATKAEVNSEISQKADEIDLSVNKKLSNYSTTTQINSAINMRANEIISSVSSTYATKGQLNTAKSEIKQTTDSISSTVSKKVGNDEIISKINQSAEAVGIKAGKIELSANDVLNLLAGNTINLSGKNISISSTNFNVDKNGHVTIKSGETFDNANLEVTDGTKSLFATAGSINCRKKSFDGNEGNYGINDFSIGYSQGEVLKAYIMGTASSYGVEFIVGNSSNKTIITPTGISTPKLTQTSLKSKKKNIKKLKINALDLVKDADICEYNFKGEKAKSKKHIGLVIGEGYNCPEQVIDEDGQGVEQYSLTSLLWKAVQELTVKVEQLEKGENNG